MTTDTTTPADDLGRALADAGRAIEAMAPHERREQVTQFLNAQGILPPEGPARDFLVGTFIRTHELRVFLTDREQVLDGADGVYAEFVQWLRDTPESVRSPRNELGAPIRGGKAMPDAIAKAALDAMHTLADQDDRFRNLLFVYDQVQREFTKGRRCSVCADADDPDYDHGTNC